MFTQGGNLEVRIPAALVLWNMMKFSKYLFLLCYVLGYKDKEENLLWHWGDLAPIGFPKAF